ATPHRGGKELGPVVVVGSSGGYGLPAAVTAAFGFRAPVVGVCLERPAHRGRTASAGWYNLAELHRLAAARKRRLVTVNADCFADATKEQVVAELSRTGPPSLLVYSVAAPLRTDPDTGVTHRSVLKPIGSPYVTKSLRIDTGDVTEVLLEPATEREIADTVQVMGGRDWTRWIDSLDAAGLVGDGLHTVAFGYLGPALTHPIYRSGTIGAAKADLEAAAGLLNARLSGRGGGAWVSVNSAAVTQASAAIPAVPLYLSLLMAVTGPTGTWESPAVQMRRLFDELLVDEGGPTLDDEGRIRLDGWELDPVVQAEVATRWAEVTTESLSRLGDPVGFRTAFRRLFGFDMKGVDYDEPVEVDIELALR
ncbi:MAG TPA: enoyl-[acyl-carrier-protein] reductase FabV, partial [Acidimicrobiales bacterium]|nr:enoyl-[acyl-carrier-protein] reductase FabV [Acidimicrobiales bacterium]